MPSTLSDEKFIKLFKIFEAKLNQHLSQDQAQLVFKNLAEAIKDPVKLDVTSPETVIDFLRTQLAICGKPAAVCDDICNCLLKNLEETTKQDLDPDLLELDDFDCEQAKKLQETNERNKQASNFVAESITNYALLRFDPAFYLLSKTKGGLNAVSARLFGENSTLNTIAKEGIFASLFGIKTGLASILTLPIRQKAEQATIEHKMQVEKLEEQGRLSDDEQEQQQILQNINKIKEQHLINSLKLNAGMIGLNLIYWYFAAQTPSYAKQQVQEQYEDMQQKYPYWDYTAAVALTVADYCLPKAFNYLYDAGTRYWYGEDIDKQPAPQKQELLEVTEKPKLN